MMMKIEDIFTIYLILPESVKYAMFIYKIRQIQFNSNLVPKTPRDSVFTAKFLCRYFFFGDFTLNLSHAPYKVTRALLI